MQDDSDNHPIPKKQNMSDNEKCIIQIKNDPHKNKTSKKKYFTINFIYLKHKSMSDSTFTSQCHCLHLHSQCLHLPCTHS